MMMSKIERLCLTRTKRTLPDLLSVARETMIPLNVLAVQIGCDHSAIYKYIQRKGIEWPPCIDVQRSSFAITINGKSATREQHCRNNGVTYFSVAKIRKNFDLSFLEALDIAVARKRKQGEVDHG